MTLAMSWKFSRDTAEKAYRHLKQLGVVGSVPGKGYFISKTDFRQSIKVFLLFNKLSAHKKIIYDSFVEIVGAQACDRFLYL
jgi:DNA-binding GntR family transcriptional regulator